MLLGLPGSSHIHVLSNEGSWRITVWSNNTCLISKLQVPADLVFCLQLPKTKSQPSILISVLERRREPPRSPQAGRVGVQPSSQGQWRQGRAHGEGHYIKAAGLFKERCLSFAYQSLCSLRGLRAIFMVSQSETVSSQGNSRNNI